jgi:hypothetical protein
VHLQTTSPNSAHESTAPDSVVGFGLRGGVTALLAMNRLIVHGFVRATLLYAFSGFSILADDVVPSNEAIKAAVVKSLPLLETAARGSMEKRKQCFTCHNQALPVMALTMARSRGITIDPENLRRQVEFTAEFLARNRTNYLAGRGQGGQALTAGYALWTLEMGGW